MSGAFHDVRFPLPLSRGAKASLVRASEIVQLASGHEVRNARWSASLRRWSIVGAIISHERLRELAEFFKARRGNVYAFRFRDAMDFSSGGDEPLPTDQLIGVGDGAAHTFQLLKDTRKITKPVADSVRVSVAGTEITTFTVGHLTGEIMLEEVPSEGAEIRAGFLFDVPARFETSNLDITLDACRAGRAASLSIVEVRE